MNTYKSQVAVCADLHFRPERLEAMRDAWEAALDACAERGIEDIIVAGDIFEQPNIGNRNRTVGTVCKAFLEPIHDRPELTVWLVSGNHDQGGPADEDALTPLVGQKQIRVVKVPGKVVTISGIAVGFLPWLNRASLLAALGSEDFEAKRDQYLRAELATMAQQFDEAGEPVRLLVGHCDVGGAKNPHGRALVGGSFELSTDQLAEARATHVALGHVHLRQDLNVPGTTWAGYVGTLVQQNFGEEGIPTGFLVLDGTGATEWVEVDGPKHFNVHQDADGNYTVPEAYRPDTDRLKVWQYPGQHLELAADVLGTDVEIAHKPEQQAAQRRTEKPLSADDDLAELLAVWFEHNEVRSDLADLQEALGKVTAGLELPASAVGSLERIDRIALRHIGSHAETDVDLSRLSGLIGVTGHNGAGKTFFLESLLGACYGTFPSRGGSLPDWVTSGYTGDAELEVAFRSGGQPLRALRQIRRTAKTTTHDAYLFGVNGDGVTEVPLAGPKVADATARARELLGDLDLLLASVFASQNDAGDLADAKPSDRQELFRKLLRAERFDVLAAAVKDMGTELKAKAEALAERRNRLNGETQPLATETERRDRLQRQLDMLATDLEKAEAAQEALRKEEAELQAKAAAWDAHAGQIDQLRADRKQAEGRVQTLEAAIAQKRSDLAGADRTAIQAATLPTWEKKVADLEAERDQVQAHRQDLLQQAAGRRELAGRLAEDRQARLDEKRAQLTVDAAHLEDKASTVEATIRQKSQRRQDRARAHCRAVQEALDVLTVRRAEAANAESQRIATLQAHLKRAGEADGLLGQTPGEAVCEACPLTAEARQWSGQRNDLERALAEAERMEPTQAFDTEIAEFRELLGEAEQSLSDAMQGKNLGGEEAKARTARAEAGRFRRMADRLAEDFEPETVQEVQALRTDAANLDQQREALTWDAAALADAKTKRQEAQEAAQRLARLEAVQQALEADEAAHGEAVRSLDGLQKRLAEAEAALGGTDPREQLAGLKDRIVEAGNRVRQIHAGREQANQALGAVAEQVQRLQGKAQELEEVRQACRDTDHDLAVMRDLYRAFGREGIPQLVIASAVPRIQEILSELLEAFDGRWAFRIETQATVQKGKKVVERIDLLVDDGESVRDLASYSGGERAVLRALLRIAFSAVQSEQHGQKLAVCFWDEVFDGMDESNAARFVTVLGRLGDWFEQVFVVSHYDHLVASLPSRIEFRRQADQTEVTVTGGSAAGALTEPAALACQG